VGLQNIAKELFINNILNQLTFNVETKRDRSRFQKWKTRRGGIRNEILRGEVSFHNF
jgi:hypothetical protein